MDAAFVAILVALIAALSALAGALIAAVAGFVGGYFAARWRAESDLAQWRRDKLLQFSADLLAAGEVGLDRAFTIQGTVTKPVYPQDFPREEQSKVFNSAGGIELLEPKLGKVADNFAEAISEVLQKAPYMDESFKEAVTNVKDGRKLFLNEANTYFRHLRPPTA